MSKDSIKDKFQNIFNKHCCLWNNNVVSHFLPIGDPMISHKQPLKITIDEIKKVIETASLIDLRILDICLKERKSEILRNGEESVPPSESLAVSNIRGTDYLYLHKRINGKTVSRIINEYDIPDLNFEAIKISPKARQFLQAKFHIEI